MQNLIRNKAGLEKPVEIWTAFGQLLLALFTTATAIISFFSDVLDSFTSDPYTLFYKLLLAYIGVLCVTFAVCYVIINSKILTTSELAISRDAVISREKYSASVRKKARIARVIMLIGIPVFVIAFFTIRQTEKTKCLTDGHKLAVVITKFSNDPEDSFSGMLYPSLQKAVDDSITTVDIVKKFIPNVSTLQLKDSLSYFMKCRKSGIIIFGMRNLKEKSFSCNIYLHNMTNSCYQVKIKNEIIPIQDPGLIELENSAEQATAISKFIEGIILAYRCEEEQSLTLLNSIIDDPKLANCSKLLAFSYLINGNNFIRLGNADSARYSYKKGLTYDKFNIDLIKNLKALTRFDSIKDQKLSSKSVQPPAKTKIKKELPPDTAIFVTGLMKIQYNGELKDFNGLTFNKSFIVKGQTYLFKGDTRVRSKKDSTNLYSYIYQLLPNKDMEAYQLHKKDFVQSICNFSVLRRGNPIPMDNITVNITLNFSDHTSYSLKPEQIKTQF